MKKAPEVLTTSGGESLVETPTGLTLDTLYRWRARVLYAPLSITQPGITGPPRPAHGPWRPPSAQANEADIRVVPEPDLVVVLVAGVALLAAFNISRREKHKRLTLERRKKENLGSAA